MGLKLHIAVLVSSFFFFGCGTYYTKHYKFQEYLSAGDYRSAWKYIEKNDGEAERKNKILYHLEAGYVAHMKREYELSHIHFQKADYYIEDHRKKFGPEVLTYLVNANFKSYQAEDYEVVYMYFYKALNFLHMGRYPDALVEVKRLNLKLQALDDKHQDRKNKFQKDAFAHLVMGLVYESNSKYNDAFIAYRNAYEIYENQYKKLFNTEVPLQLKKDLIRMAKFNGFYEDQRRYEKVFGMNYDEINRNENVAVFWMNGKGPVKNQDSFTFTRIRVSEDYLEFVNHELGLNFPLYIGDKNEDEKEAYKSISFLRIAVPRIDQRLPFYIDGKVSGVNDFSKLESVESVSDVAKKMFNERYAKELVKALARLAAKKVLEKSFNEDNPGLGSLISAANAISEKADTRNWQTLPNEFRYTRIEVSEQNPTINFELKSYLGSTKRITDSLKLSKNHLTFYSIHSYESQ